MGIRDEGDGSPTAIFQPPRYSYVLPHPTQPMPHARASRETDVLRNRSIRVDKGRVSLGTRPYLKKGFENP